MLKTTVLPKVTVSSDEVTRQRTEITLMSYDKNVHQIKIPTDLTEGEINRVLVIFTFPFDESVIQLNGAWVDGHIQFTLPNELRGRRGNVYIEIDIDLTSDRQLTFARYRLQSVVSDIDKVADGAQTVYFELFEDFVNEVADNAQQAKDAIDTQTTDVEGHANTSKQSMDSDVNSVHDYGVSAKAAIDAKVNQVELVKNDALTAIDSDVASVDTYAIGAKSNVDGLVSNATSAIDTKVASVELAKNQALSDIADKQQDVTDTTSQFKADLSDTQTTIDNQVVQANNALNQLDTTLTGLNNKMTLADTTADKVVADATTKGQQVTTAYNAFDANVAQANQTIASILALQDNADVKIKNEIANGDFSQGLSKWFTHGCNVALNKNEARMSSVRVSYPKLINELDILTINEVYYTSIYIIDTTFKRVSIQFGRTNYSNRLAFFGVNDAKNGKTLSGIAKNTQSNNFFSVSGDNATSEEYLIFKNPILINLTQIFGAGNEPTKTEMDELIKVLGGWLDGEITLTQKQQLTWLLNLIRKNAMAVTDLGGTIL